MVKIGNLVIEKYKQPNNGWQQFKVSNLDTINKNHKRAVPTKNGGWVTVNAKKHTYYLVYNGERFGQGNELKRLESRFPKRSYEVKQTIKNLYKT